MKRLTLLLFILFFWLPQIYSQTLSWVKHIYGATGDETAGRLAIDASGNIYVAGDFELVVDFDPGPGVSNLTAVGSRDLFIAKYNSSGELLWVKQIGGPGREFSSGIALDGSGNLYLTGLFTGMVDFDPGTGVFNLNPPSIESDIFICKLDQHGTFAWAKQLGSTFKDEGQAIFADAAGNTYTTGFFKGTVDFDPGAGVLNLTSAENDVYICKLDATGSLVWAKSIGGPGDDKNSQIRINGAGDIFISGYYSNSADFDPGPGQFMLNSSGGRDIFLLALNSSGNFKWARSMSGSDDEQPRSMAIDATGNILITGSFAGTVDFDGGAGTLNLTSAGSSDAFVSKYTNTGNFVWARHFGGANGEDGSDVVVTASGEVLTIGTFTMTADFDPGPGIFNLVGPASGFFNSFISRLDGNGNFISALHLAGNFYSYPADIVIDGPSSIYICGYFYQMVDFDPGPAVLNYTSQADNDIFILKLADIITGIDPNPSVHLSRIYPNPASSILVIEKEGKFDYKIFDIKGMYITGKKNLAIQTEVYIGNLPKGSYILEIKSGKVTEGHRIIVQ